MSESVYAYCERGTDPSAFAEPLNAVSNLSFLLAALLGVWLLMQRTEAERSLDHWLMLTLVAAIGVGGAIFHSFGTKSTALLETGPIGLFTLVYLGFALNRLMNLPPGLTTLATTAFAVLMFVASEARCTSAGLTLGPGLGAHVCLNGAIGYLPALAAIFGIGIGVHRRGHQAAPYLLWAAGIFAASLVFWAIDKALCDTVALAGQPVGTHFVWHLLNGVVVLLLLQASFTVGPRYRTLRRPSPERKPIAPEPEAAVDVELGAAEFDTAKSDPTKPDEPEAIAAIATPARSSHKKKRRADVVELVDTQDLKS